MRKVMLLGVSSLISICGAFAAYARSSDEEESLGASTQLAMRQRSIPLLLA
jgi:hypothetical protein